MLHGNESLTTWRCSACNFTSPWWCSGSAYNLCARCESEQVKLTRRLRRASIQRDREDNARADGVDLGACSIVTETERAYRFEDERGDGFWIPRACVLLIDADNHVFITARFSKQLNCGPARSLERSDGN